MAAETSATLPASSRSGAPVLSQAGFFAFAGALTVLSFFTAVHLYVLYLDRMPIDWGEAVLSGFATWYPWLLLGPGVFWMAARFPLEPEHWAASIALSASACVRIVLRVADDPVKNGFGLLHRHGLDLTLKGRIGAEARDGASSLCGFDARCCRRVGPRRRPKGSSCFPWPSRPSPGRRATT